MEGLCTPEGAKQAWRRLTAPGLGSQVPEVQSRGSLVQLGAPVCRAPREIRCRSPVWGRALCSLFGFCFSVVFGFTPYNIASPYLSYIHSPTLLIMLNFTLHVCLVFGIIKLFQINVNLLFKCVRVCLFLPWPLSHKLFTKFC
ncbi:hypothetical protein ANANG_G00100880 [Anguilla anguilla]|uniref:Uncharacterized protein n=1 Tax=Anguilla anguilla TaxID=7936 RepID=A0A9D3MGU0_ANGAN|nr:hypothetical protein ANANG_G00100880 [Anguilla anguilla]